MGISNLFAKIIMAFSVVFLTACAATQGPEPVAMHWTSSGPQQVEAAMALQEQGVISGLKVTRSIPAQISASGPVNVLSCLKDGGKWLEEHQECELMGEKTCTELGGTFDRCASACRNDKDAMVCILMCVPLCKFES
ncbi:hypothetical protein [Sansalvadorimonas verongulae]|uniref:hypothetical protein n=1 Tax=Sansalvadorimonas verongulae TaxID=2172824 RepID=UPI0012BBD8C8|nr:hypothetical protein [Sansalvadorimonas verongulae]MTI14221.1 hypothetical protein [Sansalvadorimonas verongulae]